MPEWTTLKRMIWLLLLRGASAVIRTVTGTAPLVLENAIAAAINSLKQYGKCTQASTPTPDAPVDILCNNGALRYGAVGKNLVNITAADIEQGAISSADGSNSGSASHRVRTIGYYPVKPNTQYTISCVIDGYTSGSSKGVFILEYSSDRVRGYTGDSSGWKSPDGYTFTTGETTNFIRIVFAKGSSTSTPTTPADISNIQLEYGDTATEYEPFVGGILANGTPEVLTVSASGAETQTVTDVPMLLSVGDYEDAAEIISGGVTRKCGVKVLDGTETWERGAGTSEASFYVYSDSAISNRRIGATGTLVSHFEVLSSTILGTTGKCFLGVSTQRINFTVAPALANSVTAFKQWLAAQYAAGTPVIVLYPLAEETTEQTTAHNLHTSNGDNVVDVTANVSPVELEVEYSASV